MLSPNPLLGQFARKQAHFKRDQHAFFPGQRPLNFELDALHCRACVRDEHGQMLPRGSPSKEFLPAPDVLPTLLLDFRKTSTRDRTPPPFIKAS
jgi:hypothetical protein